MYTLLRKKINTYLPNDDGFNYCQIRHLSEFRKIHACSNSYDGMMENTMVYEPYLCVRGVQVHTVTSHPQL